MDDFDDFILSQEDITQLDQLENISVNLLNSSFQLSSDAGTDDDELPLHPPQRKRRRCRILSESEESQNGSNFETVPPEDLLPSSTWTKPKGNQRTIIPFTENPGLTPHLRICMSNKNPADFFQLMVSDNIFNHIVDCTNQFAIDTIVKEYDASRYARLRKWKPTNITEIKKFFGLILFMGIVRLPRLSDYWTTDKVLAQTFPRTVMSRNRFEIILQMLHFSLDDEANKSDRLHRIRWLLQALNLNFQENYTPTEELCIDESMIPFRGRIIFRQYNEQKRHKYGIKEYKLCTIPGYTYKINIYAGKENDSTNTTPFSVVMNLCSDLLNKGHTLYTDNWYTSVNLARELLKNETHLVGTIRKNRRNLPKKVISTKLKKGTHIARESCDGITVLKWKDKRDVLVLSTKHTDRFQTVEKRRKTVSKPQIVFDYNRVKGAVDLTDQMAAYCSPFRKTIKWYKKLAIDLILNTALVNALTLYKSVTQKKIQIVDFRKSILEKLCSEGEARLQPERPKRLKHTMVKKEGPARANRRTCTQCYKDLRAVMSSKMAKNKAQKVVTYCSSCLNKPFLCLACFNKIHA